MGIERKMWGWRERKVGLERKKIGLERVFVEYFLKNNELNYLAPFYLYMCNHITLDCE